jgi:hypothetical protein
MPIAEIHSRFNAIVRECSEFREWARAAELSVATELREGERRNSCVSSEALEEVGSGLYREGLSDYGTRRVTSLVFLYCSVGVCAVLS